MTNIELLKVFRDDTLIEKRPDAFNAIKTATSNARMKSTQDPLELRLFLQHLRNLAQEIENYFEVGCSAGGTFYFITSYLKARNNRFNLGIANDIRDKVRQFDEFKAFMSINDVEISKRIENSHNMNIGKKYDLVFIDANHTFEGVMTDYVKWKDNAKYLAFHDVAYRGEKRMCGAPSAWMLIKQNYSYSKEFVNLNSVYSYPQGIGILHTDTFNGDQKDKWWERYNIK